MLDDGNSMYAKIYSDNNLVDKGTTFLLVTDLPSVHVFNGVMYSVVIGDSLAGLVGVDNYKENTLVLSPLDEALQRILMEYEACLFTTNESTCAIFQCNQGFALFDPHARNQDGTYAEIGHCCTVPSRH